MSNIREISTFISDGDWIESQDQSDYGIRLIQTGNIGNGEYLDKPDKAKYISEETYNKLHCTDVYPGDILISRLPDPIGRSCMVPQDIGRAITAVDCTILGVNRSNYNPHFFVYYTQTDLYRSKLSYFLTGTTRKRISRKNLEKIVVPHYSREYQDTIVKRLDKITHLISMRTRQLDKLDELVKSRFIEMFGDIHSNPKGFSYKKIVEFAKCIAGATPSTKNKDYWNNDIIPWMSSGEVNQGRIWKTEKKISQLGYDSCSTRMIPEHTVVMAMAGQGRTRGTVAIAEIPLCTNQSICSIITDDTIDADYLYTYLQFQYDNLRNISNGSAGRGGLNIKLIGQFAVLVPPLMLQKRFSLFLNECDKSKLAVQKSLDELETLKKSLMQTYFG